MAKNKWQKVYRVYRVGEFHKRITVKTWPMCAIAFVYLALKGLGKFPHMDRICIQKRTFHFDGVTNHGFFD